MLHIEEETRAEKHLFRGEPRDVLRPVEYPRRRGQTETFYSLSTMREIAALVMGHDAPKSAMPGADRARFDKYDGMSLACHNRCSRRVTVH